MHAQADPGRAVVAATTRRRLTATCTTAYCASDSGWLRQFPPRQAGADTQRSRPVLSILCSAFDLLRCVLCVICGVIFGQFCVHFGSILSLGGYLESSWGPFVSHLCPWTFKNAIFGSFWEPLGDPLGTLLGPRFVSGAALEALGRHFGSIFALFGRLSVSTSFLDS